MNMNIKAVGLCGLADGKILTSENISLDEKHIVYTCNEKQ